MESSEHSQSMGGDEPRVEDRGSDNGEDNGSADEDETLDFLDLASAPLDNPDVFDRVVKDLLDSSIDVYFKPELRCVTLGPEKRRRESEEGSIPAARIFSWLRYEKHVESIRQLWVIDGACCGDSRIKEALWDPSSGSALFPGLDVFSWLAPNISIRTVESVAPAVKHLTLVWDGCSRTVLEAWEADLKNGKLQELRVLVIMVSPHWGHRHEDTYISSELSMFQEAVGKQRDIHIKKLDEDDQAGNTNGTGNDPAKVVGRRESTANEGAIGPGDWFQKLEAFNDAYHNAFAKSRYGVRQVHDIKVAILDTGIDAGHETFKTCILRRKSFIPDTHDFIDSDGHGTHVAGLVHQVAPHAKLLIGRIFDGSHYSQDRAAEGIRWATGQGARIISCSWGFTTRHGGLRDAINQARQAGILIFASASNTGRGMKGLPFPAQFDGVCAIGASNRFGKSAEFTSPKARFMFPGTAIPSSYPRYLSEDPKTKTKQLSGCSMACAIAAGTACRILEFATICSKDPVELSENMKETFENLARERYVVPWETQIPLVEDPPSWLRGRFFTQ